MKSSENKEQDLQRQIKDLKKQVSDLKIALSESEDKLRGLTDLAPVGLFVDDAEGKAIFINKKCAELVGVPADEALDFNWIPFLHPGDRDRMVSEWEKAFKNSTEFCLEYRWVHQDGKVVWTLGQVVPILGEDGKAKMFIGTLTDITKRKQIEQELIESQRLLKETGKIGKVGGWEVNIDTGQQKWTEEVYHIHEVDLDFNPSVDAGINFYSEESRPIISEVFQRAVEYGEPYNVNLDIITAKGNRRHVNAIGIPDLEHRRVYGFFQDITSLQVFEKELKDLVVKLQEKNIELERFVYTISHDLKTPLVTISNYSGMLKEVVCSGDPEYCKKNLDVISNAAKRMQQLLKDLLDFSRVGVKVNPKEIISLDVLIKDTVENATGVISKNNTTIEVEPGLPNVVVDKHYFLQVFENLITNASRYSRSAEDGSHVKIGVIRDNEELICYIKDNGIGLESHHLEKVFGLFETIDKDSASTGIGLAIAKRIIEAHDGRIWGESEGLGHGTTFFFTLPEAKP